MKFPISAAFIQFFLCEELLNITFQYKRWFILNDDIEVLQIYSTFAPIGISFYVCSHVRFEKP